MDVYGRVSIHSVTSDGSKGDHRLIVTGQDHPIIQLSFKIRECLADLCLPPGMMQIAKECVAVRLKYFMNDACTGDWIFAVN